MEKSEEKIKNEKYELLVNELLRHSDREHEQNKRRIRIGLRCIVIIPVLFILLMFTVTSNKTVFLLLWILSVVVITMILIGIEYSDYKLQLRTQELREESKGIDSLTADRLRVVEQEMIRIQTNLDDFFSESDEEEEES